MQKALIFFFTLFLTSCAVKREKFLCREDSITSSSSYTDYELSDITYYEVDSFVTDSHTAIRYKITHYINEKQRVRDTAYTASMQDIVISASSTREPLSHNILMYIAAVILLLYIIKKIT